MPDWSRFAYGYHAVAHADDGYQLVMQPGVSAEDVVGMGERLGISLPDEFRDLYMTLNGFGVTSDNSPEGTYWLCRPLDHLPDFIRIMRKGFSPTHPHIASRFFPFIDFANGDSMGYLTETGGVILPGLACFEHELYKYDDGQDPSEFLSLTSLTIEEFLSVE